MSKYIYDNGEFSESKKKFVFKKNWKSNMNLFSKGKSEKDW